MQEATTSFGDKTDYLYRAKAEMARGLAVVAREITETGNNPDHMLEDIVRLAHILDIAAPPIRSSHSYLTDPRYHLLDYIKRQVGSLAFRGIDADEILFDKKKPFTCIGQIQEIFLDVHDKIIKNFLTEDIAYAS